ncbi:5325_t:CDS:2 [Gigaspora margarita]|uniref:RBR-type E3 ubiquitin transferase n=1 Tax=Gigaspora margarita TaxID=4874 RepID=A0ABM8W2D8_GIGMA|nr:5325_t:CDS:2 [Gigaspora margarita]
MDNGVSVESIRVVSEIDDLVNLEGKIVMHKVTPVGKQVSVDYTTDLWETYYNVLAKESCSLSSDKDLYLFEVSTFKNPNAPLYLEFAVKCDIAGSVFWTNGYQFLYDEDSQKEFFFNEFQPSSPSPSSISSPVDNEKECIICLEEFDCNEFVKVTDQCNHENDICKKCIRKHVKKEILDNEEDNELLNEGNFDILCPDDDCRAVLKEQDVKKFVSEKMFNRYEQLKLNFTLSLIPNFYRCTNQDCYSGQIHEGEDTSPIMTCIACKQKSCVVHNLPFDNIRFCCPECEKLEPVSSLNPANEAEGTEDIGGVN